MLGALSKFRPFARSAKAKPTARFMRPDSAGTLSSWRPFLRSQSVDVREAWEGVAARVQDAVQNQGWISGLVDQIVADTVGTGLALNATPDFRALGWTQAQAHEWSRDAERRWRSWSMNPLECDARGKMTVPAMSDAALRQNFAFGECLARTVLRRRSFAQSQTKVQLLSPMRLVQETREHEKLHQGVWIDDDGMPVAYRMRQRTEGSVTWLPDVDLPARDRDGRPLVIHVFDGAADQTRGISALAPVLRVTRQFDQLADATLTTTLLQTIFAGTLKSAGLSGEAFEGLLTEGEGLDKYIEFAEKRSKFYDGGGIDLGNHGRINNLFPGDEFELHTSNHPHSNYLPFSRNLLREIARAGGVLYEVLSGDYEGQSYAGLRIGGAAIWGVVLKRRARVAIPFVQPIYESWLEEEVAEGRMGFPGGYKNFLLNRAAACSASWRGPPKPAADDLKTARALDLLLERGVISLDTAGSELGVDWQAEAEQRAQERTFVMALGLPDPHAARPQGGAPGLEPADA